MSCRNFYPAWFSIKEFMNLDAAVRMLFIGLMCAADTEGRLIMDCFFILRRIGYSDFFSEEEIEKALRQMVANGLIIIYPYESEGYSVNLIQIVDYHKFQAGKSYIYGSSMFPPPEGYVVEPPENNSAEKDERFQSFYNTYPKKYKKKEAATAWSEIAPDDATYHNIMDGLSKWIPYFSSLKKSEIVNPSIFLGSKMFLSAPPTSNSSHMVDRAPMTTIDNTKYDDEGYPIEAPF